MPLFNALSRNQIQTLSLIAISILANVTMSGGRVAASLFVLRHGGSAVLAGIAYSTYSLLPALLSLLIGRWIDMVGPRRAMRTSQVVMIAGLIAPALFPSMVTVFGCALVCGIGFSSYLLAANVAVTMMPFEHHGERVGMLGWLAMGGSAAGAVGPMVVGFAIDHGGFNAAYGAMAAIVAASLVLSFCVDVPGGVGGMLRPKGERHKHGVARLVFSNPRLLRIYLLAMVVSMGYDGFAFMTPVLGQERGLSATTIGMIMSCFAVGTFSVGALLPWLSRHFTEWRMMMLAFGATAAVFMLLPLAYNGYVYGVLGFLFGFAAGAGQPNILSLIYRAMPDRAGEGAGLRSLMGNTVGLTAPSIYGSVAGMFGAVPVFIGVGCVAALASWQSFMGWKGSTEPVRSDETHQ
ncbi:MAG TPA: MFS transporter [Rhodocyclaceae bacterium]|nr:MFS transporter [Rhodocyclaceae bacterium]